jgi:hypothetical protein
MSAGTRWFASPLTGTAGVIAGLCLLAIPLRKLTSAEPVAAVQAATVQPSSKETSAVLRLRLLAPATGVTVTSTDGKILLEKQDLAAGETEFDATIPFADGHAELLLDADLGEGTAEKAIFLTVMPDGFEDQTRFVIGSGAVSESLHFEWHTH